jgi:hypothetical protein
MQRIGAKSPSDSSPDTGIGNPSQSPGRPLKGAEAMSASERSMRRMGRLAGIETAARDTTERLWWLHRELSDAGLVDWAKKVEQILKINSLRAAAGYARRNSAYFVRSGSEILDEDEIRRRRWQIEFAADEIDTLAQGVAMGGGDYRRFEEILESLRSFGFWIDDALVSAVARAFTLG